MSSPIHARATDRVRAFVAAGLRRVADRIAPPAPPSAPLSTATTLGLACNMFAAMAPLPLAPVPTGDDDTDAHNLRLFQTALAEHAQHNERLRSVGALLSVVAR